MATALKAKVQSTDNPWNTLTLKYGNNRGKLFTEEEDRFLVCMTNELGYGNWDDLKREVRRAPDFRFETRALTLSPNPNPEPQPKP